MKYRMIALDLDGTLNNDDHIITPKTREALIAVQERHGVTVVLASGRQAPGLKRESDALELEKHHGLLLSYGGGRIEDATTQDVLFSRSLPNELAVRFLRHLEKFSVSPVVDNGRAIVTTCEQNYKVQDESRNNNMDVLVVDNTSPTPSSAQACAPSRSSRPRRTRRSCRSCRSSAKASRTRWTSSSPRRGSMKAWQKASASQNPSPASAESSRSIRAKSWRSATRRTTSTC